ncbi:MAG: hypothetical protein FJ098_09535, partial [Deltaproteobacteria bacterium]|nr:hypothetical protein [Deltaproteobacteria bacterium]
MNRYWLQGCAFAMVLVGCNGGSSVEVPQEDAGAEVGAADGAADLLEGDGAPRPDGTADLGSPDTGWTDLDAGDLPPACAPGEGCFGDPCTDNKDCLSGWCVDHRGESICSETCQEECPPGWTCKQVAGTDPDLIYVCVSAFPSLCLPCATAADCTSVTGTQVPCVSYGAEGSFCGGPCQEDADCPEGYHCEDVQTVEGATLSQCVSATGTCACTDKAVALGLSTPCATETEYGSCEGVRICTMEGLSPCDAGAAEAEECDGEDDDCDGEVDEGTCDDGNACTTDACLGAGGCEHVALDGVECPDGNLCTLGDECVLGTCVGQPVACDDGNVCTDDACDPGTGDCVFSPN